MPACIEVLRIDLDARASARTFSYALGRGTSYWKFVACQMSREVAIAVGSTRILVLDLRSGNVKELDVVSLLLYFIEERFLSFALDGYYPEHTSYRSLHLHRQDRFTRTSLPLSRSFDRGLVFDCRAGGCRGPSEYG